MNMQPFAGYINNTINHENIIVSINSLENKLTESQTPIKPDHCTNVPQYIQENAINFADPFKNESRFKPVRPKKYRNPWGNLSYANLIAAAILSSPKKKMKLNEIYMWFSKTVPYFADREDDSKSKGWKNSIRHNLSLKREFIRESGEKKAGFWSIDENLLLERIKMENRQINDPQYNKDMELYELYIRQNCSSSQKTNFHPIQEDVIPYVNGTSDQHENILYTPATFSPFQIPQHSQENPFLLNTQATNNFNMNFNQELANAKPNVFTTANDMLFYPGSDNIEYEKSNDENSENCVSSVSKGSKIFSSPDASLTHLNMGIEPNGGAGAVQSTPCFINTTNQQNLAYVQMYNNNMNNPNGFGAMSQTDSHFVLSGNNQIFSGDQIAYSPFLINYQVGNQINSVPTYLLSHDAAGNPILSLNNFNNQLQFVNVPQSQNVFEMKPNIPMNNVNNNYIFKQNQNPILSNYLKGTNHLGGTVCSLPSISNNLLICNQNTCLN